MFPLPRCQTCGHRVIECCHCRKTMSENGSYPHQCKRCQTDLCDKTVVLGSAFCLDHLNALKDY